MVAAAWIASANVAGRERPSIPSVPRTVTETARMASCLRGSGEAAEAVLQPGLLHAHGRRDRGRLVDWP